MKSSKKNQSTMNLIKYRGAAELLAPEAISGQESWLLVAGRRECRGVAREYREWATEGRTQWSPAQLMNLGIGGESNFYFLTFFPLLFLF